MSQLKILQGGGCRPPAAKKGNVLLVQGARVRRIRDLSWLLRRGKQVDYFEIGAPAGVSFLSSRRASDVVMRAHMLDGTLFYTLWRSRGALVSWLDRPMFDGKRVIWFGEERRAGTALAIEESDT